MVSPRPVLSRAVRATGRHYSVVSRPHAFLQPLKGAHEGAVGLVMDRAESRNALSVRMVNVGHMDVLGRGGLTALT
jgi:hypothetical protein